MVTFYKPCCFRRLYSLYSWFEEGEIAFVAGQNVWIRVDYEISVKRVEKSLFLDNNRRLKIARLVWKTPQNIGFNIMCDKEKEAKETEYLTLMASVCAVCMRRPWNSKTRCNAAVVIVRSSCGLVPSQSSPTLFLCCIKKTVRQHFVGCVIMSWGSGVVASVHNYVSDLAAAAVLLKSVRSVDTPAACGALWLITSLCATPSLSVTARLHRGSYAADKHVSSHLCCLLSFCIVLLWAAEFIIIYFWGHFNTFKRRQMSFWVFPHVFIVFFCFVHHKLWEFSLHYTETRSLISAKLSNTRTKISRLNKQRYR